MAALREHRLPNLGSSAAPGPIAGAFALPGVRVLRVHLEALEPQRLAHLPTTAVHGALEHALRELTCRSGCDDGASCDHAWLIGPRVGPGAAEGVTDRAPGTLVIAPAEPFRGQPTFLEPGQEVAIDVALVGRRASDLASLVLAAMQRVAERGVGAPKQGATAERRAGIRVAGVHEAVATELTGATSYVLDLRTPLRLKRLGRIAGPDDIDEIALWEALHRRADVLSRLCGEVGLPSAGAPPLRIVDRRLRRVTVPRHSSRQGKWLAWPGVVGTIAIALEGEGTSDEARMVRQLLEFAGRAQLGKATSFGFGKVVVMGVPG